VNTWVYLIIVVMALCIILIPIVAYLFGGWYAYWGHALLAIIFAVMAILLKTRFYWEED
jgi:c-di-AMP phosphodiesterase-like protein